MESGPETNEQNDICDSQLVTRDGNVYITPINMLPPKLIIMSSLKRQTLSSQEVKNKERFEYLQQYYKDRGCILKSTQNDYKNVDSILDFLCKCGNPEICSKKFSVFQVTPRCSQKKYNCGTDKQPELQRKKFLEVQKYYSDRNCRLLTTEYSNQSQSLLYICSCGKDDDKTFSAFKTTPHCKNCKGMSIADIENFYKSHGCILLEKLTNVERLVRRTFLCKCNNKDSKTFFSFEKSPQCDDCDRRDYLSKIEKLFSDNGAFLFSKMEVFNGYCTLNDPTLLNYICSCGNDNCSKTLQNFTNTPRCELCTAQILKELGRKNRIPFNDAKNTIESFGYILLIEEKDYKGTDERLPCLCKRRHNYGVLYSLLKNGCSCCMSCAKDKREETCLERYNVKHVMHIPGIKNKLKIVQTKIYGGHPLSNEDVREKIYKTNIALYGGKGPLSSKDVRDKKDSTMIERFGPNPYGSSEIRDKIAATCIVKYGADNPMKSVEVRQRFIEMFRRKYGVDNPMQVPEFFSKQRKSAFQFKEYVYASGNKIMVQGYEGFCITNLIAEGYTEGQILNDIDFGNKMPEVFYDFEGSEHRYFMDLFIPHENKIIEVKSTYTLNLHLEQNIAKALACKAMGFEFEFRVYDKRGSLIEKITV